MTRWIVLGIVGACFAAVYIYGKVPTRTGIVRRRDNPRLFAFAVVLYLIAIAAAEFFPK